MNTSINNKVRRGEIYYYDFGKKEGSIQSGKRPVLVVQCDEGNNASMTTVIASLTTVVKKRYMPSHIYLGDNYGLKEPSMVLLEQIQTVNQSELLSYIGFIDSEYVIKKINNGLKNALGLWANKPHRKNDVRCLCSKCLEDYIIRRLDSFAKTKETCDKCKSSGYEYIIIEKSLNGRS